MAPLELRVIAGQVRVGDDALDVYTARRQTWQEQLDDLGEALGFRMYAPRGVVWRRYDSELAERMFRHIRGFGSYGFPENHAASFAHLACFEAARHVW